MLINLIFILALLNYPKIERYEVPYNQNLQISLLEGSLVFINTKSYTSDDFIFQFLLNKPSNNQDTVSLLNQSLNKSSSGSHSILSPTPNNHFIFERGLCGDFLTIISNFNKIKKIQKNKDHLFQKKINDISSIKNQGNNSFILYFWRIPDGLCDVNTYAIRSNNVMSFVPRSRSFSRFCIFSSLNFSQKFQYKLNFHATGSMLGVNLLKFIEPYIPGETFSAIKIRNSSVKQKILPSNSNVLLKLANKTESFNKSISYTNLSTDNFTLSSMNAVAADYNNDLANFVVELFDNETNGPIVMQSMVNYELKRPFLMVGSYDDLQIGKLLIKFQSDDSECSAIPIIKYQADQRKIYKSLSYKNRLKDKTIEINSDLHLKEKFENENECLQKIDQPNDDSKSKIISFIKSRLLFLYKIKGGNICNSNSFSFSYSTLFSKLLSLSTVSTELNGWKRIDVKCIEKGNDADAGFISLVVILVGMVIFVLLNARKFVILNDNEFSESQQVIDTNDDIHLDIKEAESENEYNES